MATQSSTMEVSTDIDKCSTSNPLSSTITIVLMALVIVFGLMSMILSVALVTVCLILRKKSQQTATQVNNEYDDIKVQNNGASIEMKSNEAYGDPRQIQNVQGAGTYLQIIR